MGSPSPRSTPVDGRGRWRRDGAFLRRHYPRAVARRNRIMRLLDDSPIPMYTSAIVSIVYPNRDRHKARALALHDLRRLERDGWVVRIRNPARPLSSPAGSVRWQSTLWQLTTHPR